MKNKDKEWFYLGILGFWGLWGMLFCDIPSIIKIEDLSLMKKIHGHLLLLGVIGILKIIADFTFFSKANYIALKNIFDKSIISTYDDKARLMLLLWDIPFLVIIIYHVTWSEPFVGFQISAVISVTLFIMIRKIIATWKARKG